MLKKPPQQTFFNTNLLYMRKFCQSLSQPDSDILINFLYPHQSLQGRKEQHQKVALSVNNPAIPR